MTEEVYGISGGGGDNVLVVTLSWDDDYFGVGEGAFVPDKTFSEISTAYYAGKTIVVRNQYDDGTADGWYVEDGVNPSNDFFQYWVNVWAEDYFDSCIYNYNANGITIDDDVHLIYPNFDSPSVTYTPTESQQTEVITYDTSEDYNGIEEVSVTVNAIPSNYVGSGIARRDASDMEQEDECVLVPSGYYANDIVFQTHLGTQGTPIATKGAVSNHSVSVTPSVTNAWGYIWGGTQTGTAISVSASELVSGSETKTANGTYDVTNLAQLVVNVSGGSDRLVLLQTTSLGALSTSSTSATDTGKTVSLASTTNWDDYDILLVDISVDTTTNGRHTSTVSGVLLTGTSNVTTKNTYTVMSNKWNSKLSSSGTASTRQSTTAYGVYINAASVSSNTLTLTVYYRYNNNSTGTLNGTYTARVYGIKLIDLIGG